MVNFVVIFLIYSLTEVCIYYKYKEQCENSWNSYLIQWKDRKDQLTDLMKSDEHTDNEKFEIKERMLREDNDTTVKHTKELSITIEKMNKTKLRYEIATKISAIIEITFIVLFWITYLLQGR